MNNQETLSAERGADSVQRPCSAFDRVRLTDATVNAMLKHGRSLEETIVALVCEKNRFTQRIIELESIAPRKIVLPDGRVMVWRCPDELVPEMPNKLLSDSQEN